MTRDGYARAAGFLFLFVIALYIGAMVIAARLQVAGDFAATARTVMASEQPYRLAISLNLIAGACTLMLAMALYVVLKDIDGDFALAALLFRTIEAALTGVSVVFGFTLLRVYKGGDPFTAFNANQLSVFAALRAAAGTAGYNIGAFFFGFGSILFFVLFLKSNVLPKWLSVVGVAGSILVPVICWASLVWPQYAKVLQFGWIPMGIAEVGAGVWLLVRGAGVPSRRDFAHA